MKSRLNLKPGQKGTKALVERYGESLLYVRYRYDEARGVRLKTVEIIVEEIASRLIPVIYIVMGLYLIRGGEKLLLFAYPEGAEFSDKTKEKLNLFLRFLGVFLVISYFPDLLRTVSSYIAYSNAPKYFNMLQEKQFSYMNAASSIWGVGCGIYLLKGGKIIEKLALQSMATVVRDDSDRTNG